MKRRKSVLFVVAHQDDEWFMSTRIARAVRQGRRALYACLTDGAVRGVYEGQRDAESTSMLTALGLAPSDLFFIGTAESIPDSRLHRHFENAFNGLRDAVCSIPIDEIVTLAYEGGHQDHDATHVIALALGKELGIVGQTVQMALYNGYRTRWRFFRGGYPLPANGPVRSRSLAGEQVWKHAFLFRHYPSQRRSLLGLFPGRFAELCLRRREVVQPVDPQRIRGRPHEGPLFYERRGRATFDDFCASRDAFLGAAGDEPG